MDPSFWIERWQKGDTGFHQDDFHPSLPAYWHNTGAEPGSTVFVPLCGKSRDMEWLAGAGHRVVGVELSELAIDDFFKSLGLVPEVTETEGFKVKSAGPYELWCGDLFELPGTLMKSFAAVYDRASLVALPPDLQEKYAVWLKTHIPEMVPLLLVSLGYDQSLMKGPPFSIPQDRVLSLLEGPFTIEVLSTSEVLHRNDALKKRGLTSLEESVYLARKPA